MGMDIAITFDIEFNINGAFSEPRVRNPRGKEALLCNVEGVEIGLAAILDILDRYQIKATFFVETLQTAWFDLDEMGVITQELQRRGHDIQLHLHPVWLRFTDPDWKLLARQNPPVAIRDDSLMGVSADRAREIVQIGLDVFEKWGLPRPTAVRTGNLFIERPLYQIFFECGLTVSSSIGVGLYEPRDQDMKLYSSAKYLDKVLEVPVTSYWGADHRLRQKKRLATVIGMGLLEQKFLLAAARKAGLAHLMLLSHVSEFVKFSDNGAVTARRLTMQKFHNLCRTIAESDYIDAVTMTELSDKYTANHNSNDIQIKIPRIVSVSRFLDRTMLWRSFL